MMKSIMSDETMQFPKQEIARVCAIVDPATKIRYPLGPERLTIGRDADNVVALPDDSYVSGHHAQVYYEKGSCWLRDLGSRNGTVVNNLTIAGPIKIQPGDVITIGHTKLEVE